MSFPIQPKENIGDGILSYFEPTQEERRQLEIENDQLKKRRSLGATFCEKINKFLDEKGGLKFKTDVERLYFDETFSFETLKCRNKENEDKLDVLIRIKPRDAKQEKDDDVQPSLIDCALIVEVGDSDTREIKLDGSGEAVLEGIEPGVLCRVVRLQTPSETTTEIKIDGGKPSYSRVPNWSRRLTYLVPMFLVCVALLVSKQRLQEVAHLPEDPNTASRGLPGNLEIGDVTSSPNKEEAYVSVSEHSRGFENSSNDVDDLTVKGDERSILDEADENDPRDDDSAIPRTRGNGSGGAKNIPNYDEDDAIKRCLPESSEWNGLSIEAKRLVKEICRTEERRLAKQKRFSVLLEEVGTVVVEGTGADSNELIEETSDIERFADSDAHYNDKTDKLTEEIRNIVKELFEEDGRFAELFRQMKSLELKANEIKDGRDSEWRKLELERFAGDIYYLEEKCFAKERRFAEFFAKETCCIEETIFENKERFAKIKSLVEKRLEEEERLLELLERLSERFLEGESGDVLKKINDLMDERYETLRELSDEIRLAESEVVAERSATTKRIEESNASVFF